MPEVGVLKRLSGSQSAHPASANQTLLRCGADRTNQSPDFRLTGSTRQPLRVARLGLRPKYYDVVADLEVADRALQLLVSGNRKE